jgi:hypothetical protein
MPPKDSVDAVVVRSDQANDTLRALEKLADRLDAIATAAPLGRWLGRSDARAAATAARQIRAIPQALAAGMREAFDIGREYGHREVELAEIEQETTTLSTLLARQAWGGGHPGKA